MKKIIVALLSAMVTASVVYAATYTNQIGQVVTVGANGVVTSITDPTVPGSATNTVGALPGVQISTAITVDATQYSPRGIGDILIGTTSGRVFVATGVATSSWVQVK